MEIQQEINDFNSLKLQDPKFDLVQHFKKELDNNEQSNLAQTKE